MRQLFYVCFTCSLLLFGLVACQDHMSAPNIAPDGQRYRLRTMTYTGNQSDIRTFTYNAANQLVGIQTAVSGQYPFTINQTNTYNGQGKPTEHKAFLPDGSGQDQGGRKVFGYDGAGRINRVTLYNIFPPPIYSYQVYMVYSDSLRYDARNRISRVDRKVYMQPVRSNNFLISTAAITLEYDAQDNPTVVTYDGTPPPSTSLRIRTRVVYEYDDKPNALVNVDFPAIRTYSPYSPYNFQNSYELAPLMKHNPVRISVYEPKPLSEDLNDPVLAQQLTASYEYSNGLPTKVSWTGERSNYTFDPVFSYTFSYTFY